MRHCSRHSSKRHKIQPEIIFSRRKETQEGFPLIAKDEDSFFHLVFVTTCSK